MKLLRSSSAGLVVALVTGACASSGAAPDLSTTAASTGSTPTGSAKASGYVLSSTEKALPCSKLTGRMQLRILDLRNDKQNGSETMFARGFDSAASTVGMWSSPGNTAVKSRSRDYAMLKAYNQRLAELNCPTFDLKAELAKKSLTELPSPTRRPK